MAAFVSSQDDHTLLYTVAGSVTIAPLLIDRLPYDVDRDLEPIAATTAIVLTLAVSNELTVRGIPELIDALRSSPGKYAWTSGPTLPRYVFAAFLKRNALQMNFVSYRDASQPQADLGEGRIQVLVTSLAASASPVQTGKAHFLAVRIFNAAMADLTGLVTADLLSAYDFGRISHLMDVGGGAGELIGAVARRYPHIRGTVFDLPRCAEAASAHLAHMGIADRVSFLAGDFFESVPAIADAIIPKKA